MNEPPFLAITFEAAGDPGPTESILTTLHHASVRATFFLDGQWAEKHTGLLNRISTDGHELGNHGYHHRDWTQLSNEEIQHDLGQTEELVWRLTGKDVKPWARPPYGATDARVLKVLEECGYHALYRNAVDGKRWPDKTSAATIYQRVMQLARDGAVIVFHTNRSETAQILPELLQSLLDRGYALGTLSSLPPEQWT